MIAYATRDKLLHCYLNGLRMVHIFSSYNANSFLCSLILYIRRKSTLRIGNKGRWWIPFSVILTCRLAAFSLELILGETYHKS